jgi:hypothetical protein
VVPLIIPRSPQPRAAAAGAPPEGSADDDPVKEAPSVRTDGARLDAAIHAAYRPSRCCGAAGVEIVLGALPGGRSHTDQVFGGEAFPAWRRQIVPVQQLCLLVLWSSAASAAGRQPVGVGLAQVQVDTGQRMIATCAAGYSHPDRARAEPPHHHQHR